CSRKRGPILDPFAGAGPSAGSPRRSDVSGLALSAIRAWHGSRRVDFGYDASGPRSRTAGTPRRDLDGGVVTLVSRCRLGRSWASQVRKSVASGRPILRTRALTSSPPADT